jgi:hypothetical protein
MAKTEYEQVLTPSLGKVRGKVVPGVTVPGKRVIQGTKGQRARFIAVRLASMQYIRPASTLSPSKSVIMRSGEVTKVVGTVVSAKGGEVKKVVYGTVKITKNVCPYGELQQRESRTWLKVSEVAESVAVQPGEETRRSHATRRDYDIVVGEYQRLLDQKYAGGLNEEQQQKLSSLRKEMDAFNSERYQKISQSKEYREFQHALQVLEEFNKNVSDLKNFSNPKSTRRR